METIIVLFELFKKVSSEIKWLTPEIGILLGVIFSGFVVHCIVMFFGYVGTFFKAAYYKHSFSKTDESAKSLDRMKYQNDLHIIYGEKIDYRVGKELEWIKENVTWELADSALRHCSRLFEVEKGKLCRISKFKYYSFLAVCIGISVYFSIIFGMTIYLFDAFINGTGIYGEINNGEEGESIVPIVIGCAFVSLGLRVVFKRYYGFKVAHNLGKVLKERRYYKTES